jgi:hypothetical protein
MTEGGGERVEKEGVGMGEEREVFRADGGGFGPHCIQSSTEIKERGDRERNGKKGGTEGEGEGEQERISYSRGASAPRCMSHGFTVQQRDAIRARS